MVFAILVLLLFWGESQSKLIRDCYWLADQFEPSLHLEDLQHHPNFRLLVPPGRCGIRKTTPTPGGSLKKIFRGLDAPYNAYPWLAKANLLGGGDGGIHCAGTIINKRHILTAAHCCDYTIKDPGDLVWYLGSDYFYHSNRTIATEKMFIPEGYYNCSEEVAKHDICVARLAEDIDFNDNVQAICVPLTAELAQGVKTEVAGFGVSDPEDWSVHEPIVQKKTVTVVGQTLCRERFSLVDARDICGTYGPCHGDSGAPMMKELTRGNNTAYWLLGVLSFGERNCAIGSITVYMRVTEYMSWILDVMEP